MDSGLTVRTTGSASQTSHAPTPTRQAVATDLASSQTVTAATSAANARNDTGQAHLSDPSRMPSVILDAQSREIIDRSTSAPSPSRRHASGRRTCCRGSWRSLRPTRGW